MCPVNELIPLLGWLSFVHPLLAAAGSLFCQLRGSDRTPEPFAPDQAWQWLNFQRALPGDTTAGHAEGGCEVLC